ncbi:MAG: pilin [Candidatus Woykebacteria bacterium]
MNRLKNLSSIIGLATLFALTSTSIKAQEDPPVIDTITPPAGFPLDLNTIIKSSVALALAIAGLIFFVMLVVGGFRYLTAGGDEKAAQEARKALTNAAVGLVIIVASFLIAQLLFAVFGLSPLVNVANPTS